MRRLPVTIIVRFVLSLVTALSLGVALPGCALFHRHRRMRGLPDNGPRILGTVYVIGTAGKFVLIQTPPDQRVASLKDGQHLTCRVGGQITANLHVSSERRPPFVVADVDSGEPHLGDEIYTDPPPSPSRTSSTAGGATTTLPDPATPAPTLLAPPAPMVQTSPPPTPSPLPKPEFR